MNVKLVQTEPLKSSHFHNIYTAISQRLFSKKDYKATLNDTENDLPRSFVSFLEVFYDKNASTLSSLRSLPIIYMSFS